MHLCVFRSEQPELVVKESVEEEPACTRVKPNNGNNLSVKCTCMNVGLIFYLTIFFVVVVVEQTHATRIQHRR